MIVGYLVLGVVGGTLGALLSYLSGGGVGAVFLAYVGYGWLGFLALPVLQLLVYWAFPRVGSGDLAQKETLLPVSIGETRR